MERASKVIISRIQNRRGLRQNLPQPLRPGEVALTGDTRQVWIGNEEVAPYGIRTYDRDISVQDLIDPVLETQIFSVEFASDLTETQYQSLLNYFSRQNQSLFPPFVPGTPDPVLYYNQTLQLLWDGGKYLFFGLRSDEITEAITVDGDWTSDPAQAITAFINGFSGTLPSIANARTLDEEFPRDIGSGEIDWLGQPGLFRVLLFDNEDLQSRASGNAASLINTVSTNLNTPDEYVTTLSNIEIGTVDEFEQLVDIPPDSLYNNPFRAQLTDTGGATQGTGFEFSADISDTLFIEYSLATSTQAAVGTLRITVPDENNAVAYDDRIETEFPPVSPPASPAAFLVTLDATATSGTIALEYTNDTGETATFSFVVKRWLSA